MQFLHHSECWGENTLLQTARWFGYRPDYENLCRILMPNVLVGRFLETARTVEELRSDLARMVEVGLTPKEFGLRVRHSGFWFGDYRK